MSDVWKNFILQHYRQPLHFGEPAQFDLSSEQHNRTCGDWVKVFAVTHDGDWRFQFTGEGCSLCLASSSIMMGLLEGADLTGAQKVHTDFQKVWADGAPAGSGEGWQALASLRAYPVRSRCVKLPWQALEEIVQSARN